MQFLLDSQQLLGLCFLNGGERHSGPAADYLFHIADSYAHGATRIELVFLAQAAKRLTLLAFLTGVEAGLIEFMIDHHIFHAAADELQVLLYLDHFSRQGGFA